MLQAVNGDKTACKIHDQLAKEDNKEVFEVTGGVRTTACAAFPTPGDFQNLHIRDKCGYYFVECPRILVVCPTHEVKEYAMARWVERMTNLTYPNYDILMVDNSPTTAFMDRWKDKVRIEHIVADQAPDQWLNRICQSLAYAQDIFLKENYERWMNIEADNIPPADIIESLLSYGKDIDWVSHAYPIRPGSDQFEQGIGCSLLSRKLMTDFDWHKAADSPDAELWTFVKPQRKYKTIELWDVMQVEHLKP